MITEKEFQGIIDKYSYYLTHSYIDIALSQSGKAYFIEFDKNGECNTFCIVEKLDQLEQLIKANICENVECIIDVAAEEDYLIILGHVGVCWDNGIRDEFVAQKLNDLPITVLWIDGNHENFELIDSLPVSEWHGGKVHFVGRKIIHLMRGYVYDICGKKFWAFDGGLSIDKIYRRVGINWWSREMPSKEEYERGKCSLLQEKNMVDYIITHTVPRNLVYKLVEVIYPGEEELQNYFQELSEDIMFTKWYFGHWHKDYKSDKYVGLYDEIECLEIGNI